jgi:hypothetical protein
MHGEPHKAITTAREEALYLHLLRKRKPIIIIIIIIIKRTLAKDEISCVSRDSLLLIGPSYQTWAFKVSLSWPRNWNECDAYPRRLGPYIFTYSFV